MVACLSPPRAAVQREQRVLSAMVQKQEQPLQLVLPVELQERECHSYHKIEHLRPEVAHIWYSSLHLIILSRQALVNLIMFYIRLA